MFVRGERKIELTEAAEVFIPFAKKCLLAARAGVRSAQSISRGEPREFEVAYCTLIDTHLIAGMKALLENAHPRIPVRFRSFARDQLMRRLLDSASHAAVTLLPVDEEVARACLLREELFLVVPDDHSLARKAEIRVAEIGDAPVIWPSGVMPSAVTKDLFSRLRRGGCVPNVVHEAQTVAESLGLAREGLGITLIKTSDRCLVGDRLKVIPLAAALPVETGLIYIRERRWELLREFVTLVTNHFQVDRSGPKENSGFPSARA